MVDLKPNWTRYERLGMALHLLETIVPPDLFDREDIIRYLREEKSKCLKYVLDVTTETVPAGEKPAHKKTGRPPGRPRKDHTNGNLVTVK